MSHIEQRKCVGEFFQVLGRRKAFVCAPHARTYRLKNKKRCYSSMTSFTTSLSTSLHKSKEPPNKMMNPNVHMQPGIILLREVCFFGPLTSFTSPTPQVTNPATQFPPPNRCTQGTDESQGKAQLISNINACQAVAEAVRTTLGPRGMDKLIHDGTKVSAHSVTTSHPGCQLLLLPPPPI